MVRGNELTAAIGEDAPSKARDAFVGPEKIQGRYPPEGADHLRAHGVDLPVEKRAAGLHLVGLGLAIIGWTAFHHVRDVDLLPGEVDRLDDLREELYGGAHERNPLTVFLLARALSDEHQLRFGVPHPEDDRRALLREPAARALSEVGADLLEGLVPRQSRGGRLRLRSFHVRLPREAETRQRTIEKESLPDLLEDEAPIVLSARLALRSAPSPPPSLRGGGPLPPGRLAPLARAALGFSTACYFRPR